MSVLDLSSLTWSAAAPLMRARAGMAACGLGDGRVFLAGGLDQTGASHRQRRTARGRHLLLALLTHASDRRPAAAAPLF